MHNYVVGKEELVKVSFARHSEIEGAHMQPMIARLSSRTPGEMADVVTDLVLKGCTVRRQQPITESELMDEVAPWPALQESTAGWLRSLRAQIVDVTTTLGSATPDIDARLMLAVVSGLEVNSFTDRPTQDHREAFTHSRPPTTYDPTHRQRLGRSEPCDGLTDVATTSSTLYNAPSGG